MQTVRRAMGFLQALRTRALLTKVIVKARLKGSSLKLDVASDLRLGRRVQINVQPNSRNQVTIGAGSSIGDDVMIHLKGGSLEWGPRIEVRRGTVFNVAGTLRLEGRNIIAYGNVIHCATSITLAECASTNEYVSIIDSTHHHDGESDFFYENTTAAPITIGANVWVCNKSSVLMGTTIGANSVIASHSVVNRDVPEATVVGGLPAKVIASRAVGGGALRFAADPASAVRASG